MAMVTGAARAEAVCQLLLLLHLRSSSVVVSAEDDDDDDGDAIYCYLVEMLANNSFARLRTNKAVHLCAEGANEGGMRKEREKKDNSIRGSAHWKAMMGMVMVMLSPASRLCVSDCKCEC